MPQTPLSRQTQITPPNTPLEKFLDPRMDNLVDTHGLVLLLWVHACTSSVWERGVMWVDELFDTIGSNLEDGYEPAHWLSKRRSKKQVYLIHGCRFCDTLEFSFKKYFQKLIFLNKHFLLKKNLSKFIWLCKELEVALLLASSDRSCTYVGSKFHEVSNILCTI